MPYQRFFLKSAPFALSADSLPRGRPTSAANRQDRALRMRNYIVRRGVGYVRRGPK